MITINASTIMTMITVMQLVMALITIRILLDNKSNCSTIY